MFKEFTLSRTGQAATIEILDIKDMDKVLALQDHTRASLLKI
jgi:hypothetical protein